MPPSAPTPDRSAWFVLMLLALANYGNFYVYDSIGPVADLLQRQRGFSDTQIGMLNAIYSLPNVVLLLVGGLLVDRLGAGRMMVWTAAICFAGALVTAVGTDFHGMAAGRLLFGIGAETFNICTLAGIVRYFPSRHLAFAIGTSLALGRAGAFSADLSPTWFASAYAHGWQPPLLIAALFAGVSLSMAAWFWWLDGRRAAPIAQPLVACVAPRIAWHDLYRFGPAYWYLLALCVLWYAVIFAFRSTFSIKYFQHVHGLELAAAGAINGYVFLAALFATPFFGWLCDRIGRFAPLLAFGALLLPLAIATMTTTGLSLWTGTVLIGISFSLVPAVMWPLTARLVPESRLGTALGLMWVVQNAGIAGANLVAGRLNDYFGAGSLNPDGYGPMMAFFFLSGAVGFGFALLLWGTSGRRRHETAMRARAAA
ncbi:MAG: MFS transporter [Steroidobacteraceae bacterium]